MPSCCKHRRALASSRLFRPGLIPTEIQGSPLLSGTRDHVRVRFTLCAQRWPAPRPGHDDFACAQALPRDVAACGRYGSCFCFGGVATRSQGSRALASTATAIGGAVGCFGVIWPSNVSIHLTAPVHALCDWEIRQEHAGGVCRSLYTASTCTLGTSLRAERDLTRARGALRRRSAAA